MVIVMFGVTSVALAGLSMRTARRDTLGAVRTYQTLLLGAEAARVTALPAAALVPGTTCDTTSAAPWSYQRCTTISPARRRQHTVRVIVRALTPGLVAPDTVVIDRASQVGAVRLGGR